MDDFNDAIELYLAAQRALKELERMNLEGILAPALNELRYAGSHFVQAIQKHDQAEERSVHLREAEQHCRRALYDIAEDGILLRLEDFKAFEDDYRKVKFPDGWLDDWTEMRKLANRANKFIQTFSANGKSEAHQAYGEAQELFRQLSDVVETQKLWRHELNKRLEDDKRRTWRWLIGTAITVAALAVSIIGLGYK
jgi:hypothetical protein